MSKCFSIGLALLLSVSVFTLGVLPVGAQEVEEPVDTDSGIVSGGTGGGIDWGVPDFSDSLVASYGSVGFGSATLATGTVTVLSFYVFASVGDYQAFYCNDEELFPDLNFLSGLGSYYSPLVYHYNGQLHCTGTLSVETTGGRIAVQYVPYDTRKVDHSNKDLEFGIAILIVLMFIAFVAFIFNKIERRKPWLRS